MKVADLKPHPKNEEIYGYGEDVSDLVEKIKKSGRVHTMTVNSDGVVLAGHRRLKACIELGIETVNAELIRGVLNNRSVSAAEELARNIDIVEIPEKEKPLIQSGKKSSYSYVEQAKQKQKPKEETKTCKTCGKTYSIHMFYKGRNECKNCCSAKDSKRRSGVIKDLFGNPLPYDKELVNSQAVKDAIAHLKRDPSKDTNEIDYDMEFKIFKKTLDDYYCVNKKFIDGEIFKDMPLEIKNKFYEEINNLSKYTQLLQMNLEK